MDASRKFLGLTLVALQLGAIAQRRSLARYRKALGETRAIDDNAVSIRLLKPLLKLARIVLPSWKCREMFATAGFVSLFAFQATLRALKSRADGLVVQALFPGGARLWNSLATLLGISILSAIVHGLIEHLRFYLIAQYRAKLTLHFHSRLFKGLTFYHASELDDRIQDADTVITTYCHEFAEHFAELPYYFLMPLFEATASLYFATRQMGRQPAAILALIAFGSVVAVQSLSPAFGRIHASRLILEEDFRRLHTNARANVEELGMHRAGMFIRARMNDAMSHVKMAMEQMAVARGHFATLENVFTTALRDTVGFIFAWQTLNSSSPQRGPLGVCGSGRQRGTELLGAVMMQRGLVAGFFNGVKSFVVNFKELSHLTEFTEKLAVFDDTLEKIAHRELKKKQDPRYEGFTWHDEPDAEHIEATRQLSLARSMPTSEVIPEQIPEHFAEYTGRWKQALADGSSSPSALASLITFDHVDIKTPSGIPLIRNLTFRMTQRDTLNISGPNGSGKTSILRVLSGLWLPSSGKVHISEQARLFFLPQHAYMLNGATLAEQLFFPQTVDYHDGRVPTSVREQLDRALSDACAKQIIQEHFDGRNAQDYLGFRASSADRSFDWGSLSGGQQQKIALTRLFLQAALAEEKGFVPVALLDESTSQMDHDSEEHVFKQLREKQIVYISVSHRQTVAKFHDAGIKLHNPLRSPVSPSRGIMKQM